MTESKNKVFAALEEVSHFNERFPTEALQVLVENKEEAIPYLRAAVDRVLAEHVVLDEEDSLPFYAMYLLGEFQDTNSFERLLRIAVLPTEILDSVLGDGVTEGLNDILYNTYDGDLALLKKAVRNVDVDEFSRMSILLVIAQLYLDGTVSEQEWKEYLRDLIYSIQPLGKMLEGQVAECVCRCHFVDMLPGLQYLYDQDRIEIKFLGDYDSCVDLMFKYDDYSETMFCKKQISAVDTLASWGMYTQNGYHLSEADYERELKRLQREFAQSGKNATIPKVGRNDLCPCGSGKKYKHCCLNKTGALSKIESEQQRQLVLCDYPKMPQEGVEGRVYLTDYYDDESIEIDKLVYLALKNRSNWIGQVQNPILELDRMKKYLSLAFQKFVEKVESEKIYSAEEYNKKYAIHYRCEDWLDILQNLLEENDPEGIFDAVQNCKERLAILL